MEKLFNKYFIACLIMTFFNILAFNMTVTIIAKYVIELGATTAVAGIISGMFALIALVIRPFSGYLADRVNQKVFFLVGGAFTVASFVGYAFAPSVEWVAFFRVTHSIGLSIISISAVLVALLFVPKERTAEGVGYIGLATTLGIALGPTVGITILDAFGYQVIFLVSALVLVVAYSIVIPLPMQTPMQEKKSEKLSIDQFISVESLPLALTAAGFAFCSGVALTVIVLLADERSIPLITLFFLISSGGMIVTRPAAGRIVDRRGLTSIMPVSFIAEAACMLIIAFANSFVAILIAAVLRVFGQGTGQTVIQGQIMREAVEGRAGVASATFFLGIDIGQGVGAIVAGYAAEFFGYTGSFVSGAIVLAICLIPYLIWLSRRKTKQATA